MGATQQTIVIHRPIDQIWQAVRDFHAMPFANGVIDSVDAVGDVPGDQPGAKRILNGAFHETLLAIDDVSHQLAYSIDDGPNPVSRRDVNNYVGRLSLTEQADGGVLVDWSSSWQGNEEAAEEFCHAIYVALLDGLKAYLE